MTEEGTMRKVIIVSIICLVLTALLIGAGFASDSGRGGRKSEHGEGHESKIYGTVEKLPQEVPGAWIVDGKEILVTKDTFIKEDHGRPAVGAYVEIEGSYSGTTFIARKIEIKGRHK
jgi:hypothetical protein